MNTKLIFHRLTVFLMSVTGYCCAQPSEPRLVGTCEGCEAIFEWGGKQLNAVDTLPGFEAASQKIRISGVIYQPDGVTPAEGVILYVYHTNEEGVYPTRGGESDWARRHGYIRGWVKTGKDGRYTFYTRKPGTYPSRTDAAHIHPTILEPDGKYYWVDEYLFEGDPLLSPEQISPAAPVGGSGGVLRLRREGGLLVGERNFILGRNVKGYAE